RLRWRVPRYIVVWPIPRLVRRNVAAGGLGGGVRHLRDCLSDRRHRNRISFARSQSGFSRMTGLAGRLDADEGRGAARGLKSRALPSEGLELARRTPPAKGRGPLAPRASRASGRAVL